MKLPYESPMNQEQNVANFRYLQTELSKAVPIHSLFDIKQTVVQTATDTYELRIETKRKNVNTWTTSHVIVLP